jgi:hypothetical protein
LRLRVGVCLPQTPLSYSFCTPSNKGERGRKEVAGKGEKETWKGGTRNGEVVECEAQQFPIMLRYLFFMGGNVHGEA